MAVEGFAAVGLPSRRHQRLKRGGRGKTKKGRGLADESEGVAYQYLISEDEAFSVFGRQEVDGLATRRRCTDVFGLFILAGAVLFALFIFGEAQQYGNPHRLFYPTDFNGAMCGLDPDVSDKPYGYFPNPLMSDIRVCVKECPNGAEGLTFTVPDGPMAKLYTHHSYASVLGINYNCLPMDHDIAGEAVTYGSLQQELYHAWATVFSNPQLLAAVLSTSLLLGAVAIMAIRAMPTVTAIGCVVVGCGLLFYLAYLIHVDQRRFAKDIVFEKAHFYSLQLAPLLKYGLAVLGLVVLVVSMRSLRYRAELFRIFRGTIGYVAKSPLLLVLVLVLSVTELFLIVQWAQVAVLLMGVRSPRSTEVELFGEIETVKTMSFSAVFLLYFILWSFLLVWALEFLAACVKFVAASVLCANYFRLPPHLLHTARTAGTASIAAGRSTAAPSLISGYGGEDVKPRGGLLTPDGTINIGSEALQGMLNLRFHLGTLAFGSLLNLPVRVLRYILTPLIPAEFDPSESQTHRVLYYVLMPLIALETRVMRYFTDSAYVMVALLGYPYMQAALRIEALLNRNFGKIPHLSSDKIPVAQILNFIIAVVVIFLAYITFRAPGADEFTVVHYLLGIETSLHSRAHHSPVMSLPLVLVLSLWVSNAFLLLLGTSADTLTTCYCIDVEMAGGTETDALYCPSSLAQVFHVIDFDIKELQSLD
ncbi:unnamed protein product [Vitrella brassicaformis CCMP3155]|uniref:Choline transporter-like protein n=4 Tax=Vitrella brassicaformis TaxID=1169539 RepID=A0A0G4EDI1_VITBC|nr:unnamed protein product [Vitrella brassicaformis CCMP3155]|eukprot:CEL93416.1 unnamed protein product [Vitrella brassicaformis CCMP3155]